MSQHQSWLHFGLRMTITNSHCLLFSFFVVVVWKTDKKLSGKSKDEQMAEKKQELEKRLQDVTGQLGSAKKAQKKGNFI